MKGYKPMVWYVVVGVVVLLLVGFWWIGRKYGDAVPRLRFDQQRGDLERAFFDEAASSGKPRGLRWKNCEFAPDMYLARERATGNLAALVGVVIQFEAIEGSDMEGLPAVGNLRTASAVFFYHEGNWHTTGRAIFNLPPPDALEHFSEIYERVEGSGQPNGYSANESPDLGKS